MYDLEWLDAYTGQSTEELIDLEGQYRTDSLVCAFEQALWEKAEREAGLSEEEYVVLAVEALEREVNNGGYGQFFMNSSNQFAPIIVEALERIGSAEAASLTQLAITILGVPEPVSDDAIDRVMAEPHEARDAQLSRCDEKYFEDVGDLARPLFEFIKANKDSICLQE